jgi:hypothetical protein
VKFQRMGRECVLSSSYSIVLVFYGDAHKEALEELCNNDG